MRLGRLWPLKTAVLTKHCSPHFTVHFQLPCTTWRVTIHQTCPNKVGNDLYILDMHQRRTTESNSALTNNAITPLIIGELCPNEGFTRKVRCCQMSSSLIPHITFSTLLDKVLVLCIFSPSCVWKGHTNDWTNKSFDRFPLLPLTLSCWTKDKRRQWFCTTFALSL